MTDTLKRVIPPAEATGRPPQVQAMLECWHRMKCWMGQLNAGRKMSAEKYGYIHRKMEIEADQLRLHLLHPEISAASPNAGATLHFPYRSTREGVMLTPDRGEQFGPGKLWSLLEMLRKYAEYFFLIGQRVHDARFIYLINENFEGVAPGERRLNEKGRAELGEEIASLLLLSKRLGLDVSAKMMERCLEAEEYPQTVEEFNVLVEVVQDELSTRQFMYVPQHRAKFYERDDLLRDGARAVFPKATQELRKAANAFAAGLNTACVFHCMRALEHALHTLANDVGVKFDVQNWQNILDQIEAAIRALAATPKTPQRDEYLRFLSEAASEFRHFKDGWRNHVSHNKVSYEEAQAQKIMEHVRDFIEMLSTRLSEPV